MELQDQVWEQLVVSATKSKGWMKFLGIIMIISGALTAISIVGILWAWIYIWLGILLLQAGNKATELLASKSPENLVEYQSKLSSFFQITGILTIVALGLAVIALIIASIMGFSMFNMPQMWQTY
ncbi:DUF5362 domain-containing protein [bacterium]|nr:DUF5362 domain-containing protein [bacterium]